MGKFNWNAYYREAYEKCRRENLVLAGRLADTERKRDELSGKYGRIVGNPLYRLAAPFRLAGRAAGKAAGKAAQLVSGGRGRRPVLRPCREESVLEAYRAALYAQKWPYQRWIDEVEAGQRKAWPTEAPDSEGFLLLTCEEGAGEAGALAWCCGQMRRDGTLLAYTHEDFQVQDGAGVRRCMPWMKPAWQPDTFLSFFSLGSLVLAEAAFAKTIADGMEQVPEAARTGLKKAEAGALPGAVPKGRQRGDTAPELPLCRVDRLWLYDFCLRAQEALAARGEEPRLLDVVGFHRYADVTGAETDGWAEGQKEPEAQPGAEGQKESAAQPGAEGQKEPEAQPGAEGQKEPAAQPGAEGQKEPEAQGAAEARLARELAAGAHVWGYTEEYLPVKEEALRRRGLGGHFAGTKEPEVLAFVPEAVQEDGSLPLVSIIIPSRDHPEVLERCVRSIRERTAYPNYEIIVIDNGSGPESLPQLERIAEQYDLHYCIREMPFNFSQMCHDGAVKARGSLLLFLNNDVEVMEENWLHILAGQAWQPHVGAVGAKLYYPEGERIQHDGVTNMGIGPSHKLAAFPDGQWYYFGQNRFTQDCLAVTGACLCVRRALWEELGGFDRKMPVAYNDVDFCFRLYEAGYTNILRNDAVLYHHESLSRGLDEQTEEKWGRLLLEKERLYAKQPQALFGRIRVDAAGRDPYYSAHLVQDAPEYAIAPAGEERVYLRTCVPEPLGLSEKQLKKYSCPQLYVTADRAQRQLKIHRQEPEIYLLDGWSYVQGADNCRYERWLTLLPSAAGEPEGPQGTEPGGAQAAEPGSAREAEPDIRQAAEPGSAREAEPDIRQAAEPGSAQETGPGGAQAVKPGSAQGTEPEGLQAMGPGRREKAGRRPALRVPLAGKYRPDVEAILPGELHIGLAGYEVRLLRQELQAGAYRIGLLCRDRETGAWLYRETGRLLRVEA